MDGLRRERLLFDDVLRKAGRDWAAQRAEMVALIKAASLAHDQRQKVGWALRISSCSRCRLATAVCPEWKRTVTQHCAVQLERAATGHRNMPGCRHRPPGMLSHCPEQKLTLCHTQALEDAAAVKRSADRETASFEAEWRQLSKLIETDRKLQVLYESFRSGSGPVYPRSWM